MKQESYELLRDSLKQMQLKMKQISFGINNSMRHIKNYESVFSGNNRTSNVPNEFLIKSLNLVRYSLGTVRYGAVRYEFYVRKFERFIVHLTNMYYV